MKHDELIRALAGLTLWATGNGTSTKDGNPYCKPEVREAIRVLASLRGKTDLETDEVRAMLKPIACAVDVTKSHFPTLHEALEMAHARAYALGAEFDPADWGRFTLDFGPIRYGDTVRRAIKPAKFNDKFSHTKALTVVIYRLESGTYELTSYIN